jgi:hypothetical protein
MRDFTCFFGVVILAGCSTTVVTPYPKNWENISNLTSSCQEISGRYYLEAKEFSSPIENRRLDSLLFGKYLNDHSEKAIADVVVPAKLGNLEIILPPDKVISNAGSGYSKLDGEASCADGWINLTLRGSFANEGRSVWGKTSIKLRKMNDGSLLVYTHETGGESSMLLLWAFRDFDGWYLFERIK